MREWEGRRTRGRRREREKGERTKKKKTERNRVLHYFVFRRLRARGSPPSARRAHRVAGGGRQKERGMVKGRARTERGRRREGEREGGRRGSKETRTGRWECKRAKMEQRKAWSVFLFRDLRRM